MKIPVLAAGAAALVVTAMPAAATVSKINLANYKAEVDPLITAISAADVAASRTYGSYVGVGSIFISYASTATTGYGALCTGALTSNRTVLTAGHCLSNYTEQGKFDPVKSITFFLPSLGEATPALIFTGTSSRVDPNFDPTFAAAGSDLAQFKLTTDAPFAGYQLYTAQDNSEIGSEFTRVGTGTTGDETGTGPGPYDFDQRAGNNIWQYTAADVLGLSSSTLLSEFTDGTTAHDPFYQIGGQQQPPIANEVNSSPGDSGGPEFIDGKIAGVTSFGLTGAVIDGACGPGQIDPYPTAPVNSGLCTNSSIGEISGDTQVSAFLPFINNYIASVPEPASWTMMVAGFGLVGTMARRRSLATA